MCVLWERADGARDSRYFLHIQLLKLDQRQAAEIFGGGPNAFSRYEIGKTQPPLALVQLLRLIANHPEVINELKPKGETVPTMKSKSARRERLTV